MKVDLSLGAEEKDSGLITLKMGEPIQEGSWRTLDVQEIGYVGLVADFGENVYIFLPDDYGQLYKIKGTLNDLELVGVDDPAEWWEAENAEVMQDVYEKYSEIVYENTLAENAKLLEDLIIGAGKF